MAEILPFPLNRRRAFILRQARWFAEHRAQTAEINLRRQIHVQREALLRRCIHAEIVDRQCRELEDAIRTAAFSFVGASNG